MRNHMSRSCSETKKQLQSTFRFIPPPNISSSKHFWQFLLQSCNLWVSNKEYQVLHVTSCSPWEIVFHWLPLCQPNRKLPMPVKHLKDYCDNALTAFRLRTIHIICIQDENTENIQSPILKPPFCKYTLLTTKIWPNVTSVLHCTVYPCIISLILIHAWQQVTLANKTTPHSSLITEAGLDTECVMSMKTSEWHERRSQ